LSTPFRLQIPRPFVEEMLAQAVAELPNECCGLLAGKMVGANPAAGLPLIVAKRYPLVNAAASPTEYLSDADGLFAAHKDMRRLGIDILAIYHSHPTSPPVPSHTDRDRAYYPNVVYLIISLQTDPPILRGWWLTPDNCSEAEWDIIDDR
jgi:proteasome lid subunit RPN8/RPN11